MRLHGSMTVNGRAYSAGDEIPGLFVYPFFLIHMLAFGLSGFILAYSGAPVEIVFMHGGIAILVYTIFYLAIFGRALPRGVNLELQVLHVGDFPWFVHVVPFLYFVLYTFLIRHAVLDLLGVRDDEANRKRAEYGYIAVSVIFYLATHFIEG